MTDPVKIQARRPLPYIDRILEDRRHRELSEDDPDLFVHFGCWDSPPSSLAHAEFRRGQQRLNDKMLQWADVQDGQAILDVGCGLGGTIAVINAGWCQMDLLGLDIEPRQVEIAAHAVRAQGANTIGWVIGDACALPFAQASLDRIVAIECVHHCLSRRAFVQEVARVLRPAGRAVVADFVPTSQLRALRDSTELRVDLDVVIAEGMSPWPDFWGADSQYDDLAHAAGLTIERREDATAATLPSYQFFLHDRPLGPAAIEREVDPLTRANLAMEWLQRRGALRVIHLTLVAPVVRVPRSIA